MVRDESTPGAAPDANGTQDSRRRAVDRVREPLPTHVDATPELPPGYHDALDAGLAAIGLDLPPAVRTAIDGHVRLLLAWTVAINLTAVRDPVAVATGHVLDSLTAVAAAAIAGAWTAILDLGSGGGLPGHPARARPARHATPCSWSPSGRRRDSSTRRPAPSGPRTGSASRTSGRRRSPATRGIADAGPSSPPGPSRPPPTSWSWPSRSWPSGGRLVAWKRGDLREERGAAAIARPGARWRLHRGPRRRRARVSRATGSSSSPGAGGSPTTYPRDPAARKRRPW